jgi:hypothetical protein
MRGRNKKDREGGGLSVGGDGLDVGLGLINECLENVTDN